jgi:hypothetical protein
VKNTEMQKVVLSEIHGESGDLVKIVATHQDGEHIYDFLWTQDEPNTHENREEFRKWVSRFLANKGFE